MSYEAPINPYGRYVFQNILAIILWEEEMLAKNVLHETNTLHSIRFKVMNAHLYNTNSIQSTSSTFAKDEIITHTPNETKKHQEWYTLFNQHQTSIVVFLY